MAGAPSVPGLPARGPTASGDAAWSVSRSPGGKGSKPGEPLQAARHSGTSVVGTGPIAQFPFPRTRPALHPRQTPVTTGSSRWPKPRASWKKTGNQPHFLKLKQTMLGANRPLPDQGPD